MKILFFLIIVFSTIFNVKSQIVLAELESLNGMPQENHYYKDVHNYLDPFVGTWVYTNGNTSLKIVIEKKEMAEHPLYYEDILLGGYQYIENGIEKINTIPMLADTQMEWAMSIFGNRVLSSHHRPECVDCAPEEKRMALSFIDPIHQLSGELILRRITVSGQPALKAYKRTTNYFISMDAKSPYSYMIVPSGEYILIKQ